MIPTPEAREFARGLTDSEAGKPLWAFPPLYAEAIKHERRHRFNTDIDDVDAPVVIDE